MMNVVHVSLTVGGGAGIAARRSVEALRRHGMEEVAFVPVDRGLRNHLGQSWWSRVDGMAHKLLHPRRKLFTAWSNNLSPTGLAPAINALGADLVHLHWLGYGALHWKELARIEAPVVWTLHDAWAFTGGCHYPGPCTRFQESCGKCPQLRSHRGQDLSWRNLRRKKRHVNAVARWVAPSKWLGRIAAESGTIPPERVRVIPNGLDGDSYSPVDGRAAWKVPENALILVAGAVDWAEPRKGALLLPEMFRHLRTMTDRPCVPVIFGQPPRNVAAWPEETRWVGPVGTPQGLAEILGMADLFVLPSLQDNLPNVVMEALACGCPTVGFDSGGLVELVESGQTGWVSAQRTARGLAEAVSAWLKVAPRREEVTQRCRSRFESRYTLERHARALVALYDEVRAENAT